MAKTGWGDGGGGSVVDVDEAEGGRVMTGSDTTGFSPRASASATTTMRWSADP